MSLTTVPKPVDRRDWLRERHTYPLRVPLVVRFWRQVNAPGPIVCWLWEGARNNMGYGAVNEGGRGRALLAHRVAYELLIGPIPEGLQIDHLCRNRLCVNPDHLEPVTGLENMRRIPRPVCKKGHPYTEATMKYRRDGTRQCLICDAGRRARYEAKKRAR